MFQNRLLYVHVIFIVLYTSITIKLSRALWHPPAAYLYVTVCFDDSGSVFPLHNVTPALAQYVTN